MCAWNWGRKVQSYHCISLLIGMILQEMYVSFQYLNLPQPGLYFPQPLRPICLFSKAEPYLCQWWWWLCQANSLSYFARDWRRASREVRMNGVNFSWAGLFSSYKIRITVIIHSLLFMDDERIRQVGMTVEITFLDCYLENPLLWISTSGRDTMLQEDWLYTTAGIVKMKSGIVSKNSEGLARKVLLISTSLHRKMGRIKTAWEIWYNIHNYKQKWTHENKHFISGNFLHEDVLCKILCIT